MVICTCGHTIDAHDRAGCGGDRRLSCACPHDRFGALEDAVNAARRTKKGASLLRRHGGLRNAR